MRDNFYDNSKNNEGLLDLVLAGLNGDTNKLKLSYGAQLN
jgi:hypothetical protein